MQVAALAPLSALSAVVLIALICGRVMAENAAAVVQAGPRLLAAVFALHAGKGWAWQLSREHHGCVCVCAIGVVAALLPLCDCGFPAGPGCSARVCSPRQ